MLKWSQVLTKHKNQEVACTYLRQALVRFVSPIFLDSALRFCSLLWGLERREALINSHSLLFLPCCGLCIQLPNTSWAAGTVGSHLPLLSAPLPDSVALGTNPSSGADHVHEREPINAVSSVWFLHSVIQSPASAGNLIAFPQQGPGGVLSVVRITSPGSRYLFCLVFRGSPGPEHPSLFVVPPITPETAVTTWGQNNSYRM